MNNELDLTIFVSCYNEAHLIESALQTAREAVSAFNLTYEVLIYDDASTDSSVQVINDYIARNGLQETFHLVANPRNEGIGRNYYSAAARGRGRYFFILHGDSGPHLEAVKAIFNLLGKADIVLPYFNTKLFNPEFNCDHRNFRRRLLSVCFVKLIRLLSGHELRYFNGLVLHKRANVLKHRLQTFGLGHQAELLCELLNDPSISFLEVKVHNYDRVEGASTAFRLKNVISVGMSLVRIVRRRIAKNAKRIRAYLGGATDAERTK